MEAIKDTVTKIMQEAWQKKTLSPGNGPWAWLKKALTKRELAHIKVNYFRKGVLSLNVDSSSWLYSLHLKKETLLLQLKEKAPTLREIRFYVGEIR
jgi:predicted nucleic acid-binding Zn ribbon protein